MAYIPRTSGKYSYRTPKQGRAFARNQDPRYNSRAWRALSKHQRAMEPLCAGYQCARLAQVCDHITPVNDGGDFWHGPFQSLCHTCHNKKSAHEMHARKE